jgi:hypothetical protein
MWEWLTGRGLCADPGFHTDRLWDRGYLREPHKPLLPQPSMVRAVLAKSGVVHMFINGFRKI